MSSNVDYDNSIHESQGDIMDTLEEVPVGKDDFDKFETPEIETVRNLQCPVCGNRGMYRYALSNKKENKVIFECIKCGSTPPSYSELSDIQRYY